MDDDHHFGPTSHKRSKDEKKTHTHIHTHTMKEWCVRKSKKFTPHNKIEWTCMSHL
jgi:hypothetical protein